MPGIPTNTILQPSAVSRPQANLALMSSLQLLAPQYYSGFVNKYGDENYTWWLSTYAGMEEVKNDTFFWFESRGKLMVAVTNLNAVVAPAAGATVSLVLASGDHFDSGTDSPLRVGETVRIASSNIEGKILTINETTPGAHAFTVRPLRAADAFVSQGSANLLAGEILIFGGDTDAGEASDSIEPLIDLDTRYENYVSEMRETWSATDKAEMAEVFYKNIPAGMDLPGARQAGTSLYTLKGLRKSNQRFVNNVEFKLMRGNRMTNTGLTNSKGTIGMIPQIQAVAPTITYTPGSMGIAKMHEITRQNDVQGSAKSALWLQDIFQRQDFGDSLFQAFPAGAFVWGKNEQSQEAAINYGVQSISIDGYMFKVKKYSAFNTEVTTGKSPDNDYFRNYGIIIPDGETRNGRLENGDRIKHVTVMYQEPPAIDTNGTLANGIRVWRWGGGSRNPSNGKMVDNIETMTYRGIRVAGANSFTIVDGL